MLKSKLYYYVHDFSSTYAEKLPIFPFSYKAGKFIGYMSTKISDFMLRHEVNKRENKGFIFYILYKLSLNYICNHKIYCITHYINKRHKDHSFLGHACRIHALPHNSNVGFPCQDSLSFTFIFIYLFIFPFYFIRLDSMYLNLKVDIRPIPPISLDEDLISLDEDLVRLLHQHLTLRWIFPYI